MRGLVGSYCNWNVSEEDQGILFEFYFYFSLSTHNWTHIGSNYIERLTNMALDRYISSSIKAISLASYGLTTWSLKVQYVSDLMTESNSQCQHGPRHSQGHELCLKVQVPGPAGLVFKAYGKQNVDTEPLDALVYLIWKRRNTCNILSSHEISVLPYGYYTDTTLPEWWELNSRF